MKSLQERRADRERRKALARRESSPAQQELRPQDQVDYDEMTVAELKELAKSRDIDVEGTKKADYVAALKLADEQDADQGGEQQAVDGIPPVKPWGSV